MGCMASSDALVSSLVKCFVPDRSVEEFKVIPKTLAADQFRKNFWKTKHFYFTENTKIILYRIIYCYYILKLMLTRKKVMRLNAGQN